MLRKIIIASASLLMLAGTVRAETLSLSAMGFVRYDPQGNSQDPNPDNGTLSPVIGVHLFANAGFPVNAEKICKLTLTYGDTNQAETIRATLFRKKIALGGVVNAAPQQVATVVSGTIVTGMRQVTTSTIANPIIDNINYFYYVDVNAMNFNTPLVGVQIVHKTTCP
jgi:hypothetical protein